MFATEKEKLIGELMVVRKEMENLQRHIKFMEGEKNNAVNEREKIKSDFTSLQLELKKTKDELDYAKQAEKLTSEKYEAHSKEYFEMKTKFEIWIEDKQRFEDLERSKQEAVKKVEVSLLQKWIIYCRKRSGQFLQK